MINQNIHLQPCSPQIGMDEPEFPAVFNMESSGNGGTSSLESSTKSYLAPAPNQQQQKVNSSTSSLSSKQKKSTATAPSYSTNTSVDTDDEVHDGLGPLETSSEFDPRDQQARYIMIFIFSFYCCFINELKLLYSIIWKVKHLLKTTYQVVLIIIIVIFAILYQYFLDHLQVSKI